jgi:hypothetical protein
MIGRLSGVLVLNRMVMYENAVSQPLSGKRAAPRPFSRRAPLLAEAPKPADSTALIHARNLFRMVDYQDIFRPVCRLFHTQSQFLLDGLNECRAGGLVAGASVRSGIQNPIEISYSPLRPVASVTVA